MSGFTVKTTIGDRAMADILITAIESGGYGSVVAKRPTAVAAMEPPEALVEEPWYGWLPLVKGGYYTVFDKYDDGKSGRIDRYTLQRGLEVLQEKYPKLYSDLVNESYDVIAADALLQAAAFGDVIYG
jgi:hypothetical protein